LGLSIPITKVSFSLQEEEPKLTIEPPLEDDSANWSFRLLHPTPKHVAALCIDVRHEQTVTIEVDGGVSL
jgi:hypothetical protein